MDPDVVSKVQKWVVLDNKIEVKKAKLKEYQDDKKQLEEEILEYIHENNKTNLQINTSDGYINFVENKSQQAITIKFLKDTLPTLFKQSKSPPNAEDIITFLLNNREVKKKTVMCRHIQ
jgi:chromosomal replication initiation ATPase DnaA